MASSSDAIIPSSSTGSLRPIGLKVSKLLTASPATDASLISALDTMAKSNLDFGSGSGTLRRNVEKLMTDGSKEFHDSFSEVENKLQGLQSHLDSMYRCCDEIDQQLARASKGTRYLLEHAEGLREQRATTALRLALAQAFLARFTLSPGEIDVLSSRDNLNVGPSLFSAIDRLQSIRADCRALLSGDLLSAAETDPESESELTKAGMSIMSSTAQRLDSGYAKMAKWATFQVRGKSGPREDPSSQVALEQAALETAVSDTMRECIRRLKARPDLLRGVLDLLASSRSSSLLSLFLTALTRGGPPPTYLPRPIELHAHDPLRYVGDMLAWIHQAMAGEREFLESLFGVKADGRWMGSIRPLHVDNSTDDGLGKLVESDEGDEGRIRRLLDRHLDGCGRPLKIRVNQTIKSQEGSLVAFKLSQLIAFYQSTFTSTVGFEAGVTKVLAELSENGRLAFFDTLSAQGRSLLRFIRAPESDLSPPLMLRDSLSTLKDLMHVHALSLQDGSSPRPGAEGFEDVLEASLFPALEMCTKMGEMRSSQWDRNIFAINCIAYVQAVLEPFSIFTSNRLNSLDDRVREHVESLTSEHFDHLLKECGLEPIVKAIDIRKDDTPLSHLPEASPRVLSASVKAFDHFLSTIDVLSSPRLALLSSPRVASAIHRASLGRITSTYCKVYDVVMVEKERYEFRSTVMRRSQKEVETLLGTGAEGITC